MFRRGLRFYKLVSAPVKNLPCGHQHPRLYELIATGRYMGAAGLCFRDNRSPASAAVSAPIPARAAAAAGSVDEAMNICELKRFATDWAYAQGFPPPMRSLSLWHS